MGQRKVGSREVGIAVGEHAGRRSSCPVLWRSPTRETAMKALWIVTATAAAIGLSGGAVLGAGFLRQSSGLNVFVAGEVAKADDVNANFSFLEAELGDLRSVRLKRPRFHSNSDTVVTIPATPLSPRRVLIGGE